MDKTNDLEVVLNQIGQLQTDTEANYDRHLALLDSIKRETLEKLQDLDDRVRQLIERTEELLEEEKKQTYWLENSVDNLREQLENEKLQHQKEVKRLEEELAKKGLEAASEITDQSNDGPAYKGYQEKFDATRNPGDHARSSHECDTKSKVEAGRENASKMKMRVTKKVNDTKTPSEKYHVKTSAHMIIDCLGSRTIGPPPSTRLVPQPGRNSRSRISNFYSNLRLRSETGLETAIPCTSSILRNGSTAPASSGRIAFVDDVAVCPKTDDLYILGHLVNATTSSVICYSIDGQFLGDMPVAVQGDSHIAVDSGERFVVSDCKGAEIGIHRADREEWGALTNTWRKRYWTYLQGVACDSKNNVYVADRDTHTIYFYDDSGTRIGQFGPGSSRGLSPHLTQPWGLALIDLDSEEAVLGLVTDLARKNVVCFDVQDEEYIGQLGPKRDGGFKPQRDANPKAIAIYPLIDSDSEDVDEGTKELLRPKAVAFDKKNGVVLASNNAKYGLEGVEVFNIEGAHIGTIRDRARKFKNIMGLAMTSKGDVVVADREQILVF